MFGHAESNGHSASPPDRQPEGDAMTVPPIHIPQNDRRFSARSSSFASDEFAGSLDDSDMDHLMPNTKIGRDPAMRTPAMARDTRYAVAFVLHIGWTVLACFFTDGGGGLHTPSTWIPGQKAGVWATQLMLATLFGAVMAGLLLFIMLATSYRVHLLMHCIPAAAVMEVALGVVIVGFSPEFWALGLLLVGVAVNDLSWRRSFKDQAQFLVVICDMVVDVLTSLRSSIITTAIVLTLQTLYLLWWGSALVASLKGANGGQGACMLAIMLLSLYWTTQVCCRLVTFCCSGTMVAWCSHKLNAAGGTTTDANIAYHFLRLGLTSSFGSVCKGALLCPVSQIAHTFARFTSKLKCRQCAGGCTSIIQGYHDLTFVQIAAYSSAFSRAAAEVWQLLDKTGIQAILDNDLVGHAMQWLSVAFSCPLVIMLAAAAAPHAGDSWALFASIILCIVRASMVVVTEAFRASAIALYVQYIDRPDNIGQAYPIIFHRLERTSELMQYQDQNWGS